MPKLKLPKGASADVSDIGGLMGPLGLPAAAIALLPKAKVLENLLNHIEDLKGTPFEAAAEFLAEKAPWVFGHIGKVDLTGIDKRLGTPFQRTAALGAFRADPQHFVRASSKGLPAGDISLNPNTILRFLGADPSSTLAHEVTHGAQALMKGPRKADRLYHEANRELGYTKNPYEIGANVVGKKVKQAVKMRGVK